MLAALRGELVELVQPKDDHVLMSGIVDAPDDAAEWREELETREAFLSYVAELEAWLGTHLHPPAQPTSSDAGVRCSRRSSLSFADRKRRSPGNAWSSRPALPGRATMDRSNLLFLQPPHARLFERDVYLGMELLHLPEGRVEGDPDHLAIVPVGDTGFGTSRLHHPDETPSEAATPLGATR